MSETATIEAGGVCESEKDFLEQAIEKALSRVVEKMDRSQREELEKIKKSEEFNKFRTRTSQPEDLGWKPDTVKGIGDFQSELANSGLAQKFLADKSAHFKFDLEGCSLFQKAVGLNYDAATESSLSGLHINQVQPLPVAQHTFLRGIFTTIPVQGTHVVYPKVTGVTNNASWVPENRDPATAVEKPQSSAAISQVELTLKKIATWIPVSTECKEDLPQFMAIINSLLREMLQIKIQSSFIAGDGVGQNPLGFFAPTSGINRYLWSSGRVGDTKIDAVLMASMSSACAGGPPNFGLMNCMDLARILNEKGSDGHYIGQGPAINLFGSQLYLWGLPIFPDSSIPAGKMLLGNSSGALIYDRRLATLRTADQHEGFFIKNMVLVLAEERLGLGIIRPESFTEVTFDSAPVAGP